MIFGYWTAGARPNGALPPRRARAAWKSQFATYRVFGDEHVRPLLQARSAEAAALFDDICIPACRADIARLALLHRYGGMYVDAHCAPGDPELLALVFERMRDWELILFDERPNKRRYRHIWILNSMICGHANSALLDGLLRSALFNLERHRAKERLNGSGHVEYEIYSLTGPWMILSDLFDATPYGAELQPQYRDRVLILPLNEPPGPRPVHLYTYNSYRKGALHWSKRQLVEPLFRSAGSGAVGHAGSSGDSDRER